MTAEDTTDPLIAGVDQSLAAWRQGDCALGVHWFAHRMEPAFPITEAGREAARVDATVELVEQQVAGLVIVTQTCDVVRSCAERPYIEVCPLVEVEQQRLLEIERGRRLAYGFISLLASRRLVADLDRTMTVEKPVVEWTLRQDPRPGCSARRPHGG